MFPAPPTVTLRDERTASGTRSLVVRLEPNGDLLVQGQDLGRGVESALGEGVREYEWSRKVRAAELPRVLSAFEAEDGRALLAIFHQRFSGPQAAGLDAALESTGVTIERWARYGD
jgi:hypothetical protein